MGDFIANHTMSENAKGLKGRFFNYLMEVSTDKFKSGRCQILNVKFDYNEECYEYTIRDLNDNKVFVKSAYYLEFTKAN